MTDNVSLTVEVTITVGSPATTMLRIPVTGLDANGSSVDESVMLGKCISLRNRSEDLRAYLVTNSFSG